MIFHNSTGDDGISGDIDVIAVTPPKEISPNTENIKLYKGARNIMNAAGRSGYIEVNNETRAEDEADLKENCMFSAFESRREEESLNISFNGMRLSPWNGEEDNLQSINGAGDSLIDPDRDSSRPWNGEEDNLQAVSGGREMLLTR